MLASTAPNVSRTLSDAWASCNTAPLASLPDDTTSWRRHHVPPLTQRPTRWYLACSQAHPTPRKGRSVHLSGLNARDPIKACSLVHQRTGIRSIPRFAHQVIFDQDSAESAERGIRCELPLPLAGIGPTGSRRSFRPLGGAGNVGACWPMRQEGAPARNHDRAPGRCRRAAPPSRPWRRSSLGRSAWTTRSPLGHR